jgi:N-acyl-D-aspartate/D-glutamate deacylase
MVGKTIQAIANLRGCDPFDAYLDLIVENGHSAEAIFDYIDESNIRLLLKHPAVMICSDGQVLAPYGFLNDPPPYSPCSYSEFPGALERYVRLGLRDRGVLREGAWADIVIFDLERIHDRATNLYPHSYPFENYPHQYPEGIDYVLVNGVMVVEEGEHSGALAGIVLKRIKTAVSD